MVEHDIDLDVLPHLADSDLRELGLSLGHRRRLMGALAQAIAAPSDLAPAEDALMPAEAAADTAERRQISVLFCDLVGSTALAREHDPEEWRDILFAYQRFCRDTIERAGGYVARFLGDGVLAYFGYPLAAEDDAECAVGAGLALADGVAALATPQGRPLAARIGISTGPVVIGEMSGGGISPRKAAVGEAPNLAARLQALCQPGTVIVAAATRRLASGRFIFEDGGSHRLAGYPDPIETWRAIAARAWTGRATLSDIPASAAPPLVGRGEDIGLLLDRVAAAAAGHGQTVVIRGEAGIGKSQLIATLLAQLADADVHSLRFHCSSRHTGSVLYPLIAGLRQAVDAAPAADTAERMRRLRSALGLDRHQPEIAVWLLADLLGIGTSDRSAVMPQEGRARTLSLLTEQLAAASLHKPFVITVEDVHWADPTTLELLDRIVQKAPRLRVLCILTCRPDFDLRWTDLADVTAITLGRLDRRHVPLIVTRVAGGKRLPPDIVAHIVAKADGVPLFVEELTKDLLSSGVLEEGADGYTLNRPLAGRAIPDTLQGLLTSRLDRLGTAREFAQIASVIGREFSEHFLLAVTQAGAPAVRDALDRLLHAEIIQRVDRSSAAGHGRFAFRHALIQDAAYSGLLKRRCQFIHQRVAAVLIGHAGEAAADPGVIAHHLTEGRMMAEALPWWRRAAETSLRRCANDEALRQIERALQIAAACPDTPERRQHEINLLSARGAALLMLRGQAAAEVMAAYEAACAIGRPLGASPDLFAALFGLWRSQLIGAIHQSKATAEELTVLADRLASPSLKLGARMATCLTAYNLTELDVADRNAAEGITLFEEMTERDRQSLIFVIGQHPYLACLNCRAFIALLHGQPEPAVAFMTRGLAFAESLAMAFQLSMALFWSALFSMMRGAPRIALEHCERALSLMRENGLAGWSDLFESIRGAALVGCGDIVAGRGVLERLAEVGGPGLLVRPHDHVFLVRARLAAGDLAGAWRALETALGDPENERQRWWQVELLRLRAAVRTASPWCDPAGAAADLQAAASIVRTYGIVLLEADILAAQTAAAADSPPLPALETISHGAP